MSSEFSRPTWADTANVEIAASHERVACCCCDFLSGASWVAFLQTVKGWKMHIQSALALALASVTMTACMNMPTPPSQITGSYTSSLRYEEYTCSHLASELASLARRENQLVIAQQQRIKTSEIQAFLWGYGQGDSIEASELATVRGDKEAVRTAMERKGCRS
jgi:hypothetical protein